MAYQFLFILLFSSLAFAQEGFEQKKKPSLNKKAPWVAYILREKSAPSKIQDLNLDYQQAPVFLVAEGDRMRPLVQFKFRFKKKDWKILDAQQSPMTQLHDDGTYNVYAYLKSRISTVDLYAQDPNGNLTKETLYLFAPEAREFKSTSKLDSILFTMGHSYLEYNQASYGKYVSQSLLLGIRYLSPMKFRRFGFYGDIFSTVFTYESSPQKQNSNFLEARLGLTYSAKVFKHPKTRSRVLLGLKSTNLFAYGEPLGFKGLWGPNMGLRTEYFRSGANSWAAELQYTPYESSDPLNEREFKLSVDWNHNLKNLRKAQIGLSYQNMKVRDELEKISANLLSVYVSLSF